MLRQLVVGALLTVFTGQTVGCRRLGSTERQLRELGTISVPSRLKASYPFEQGDFARFAFDRSALWPMGSNRPVPERLVVAVWTPASRDSARAAAVRDAKDRTDSIRWRNEEEYLVGEGLHSVNTAENPAWLLMRDFEDRSLTIAYMTWKKDRSLAEAREILEKAYESFRPAATPSDYLAIARERPAKERRQRRQELDSALAVRGVSLTLDGHPVERNGMVYMLYTDERLGTVVAALYSLGSLPLVAPYRHLRPPPPNGIGNWPSVQWFEKGSGTWQHHGVDGDYRLPLQIDEFVGALHASEAHRAHFYVVEIGAIDDLEMPPLNMAFFDRASTAMATLFKEGKLIEERRD